MGGGERRNKEGRESEEGRKRERDKERMAERHVETMRQEKRRTENSEGTGGNGLGEG